MVAEPASGRKLFRLARPQMPPALAAVFAVLGLLPRVSARLTFSLTAIVLVSSALPIAVVVVAGLLVGSVPAALGDGLDSPAGEHALTLLGVATLLIVAERLLGDRKSVV